MYKKAADMIRSIPWLAKVTAAPGAAILLLILIDSLKDAVGAVQLRPFVRLLALPLGACLVAFLYGLYEGWQAFEEYCRKAGEKGPKLRTLVICGVSLLLFITCFFVYGLGFHINNAMHSCRKAGTLPSISAREEALAAGSRQLASVFALPARFLAHGMLWKYTAVECSNARKDLERLKEGLCPRYPLPGTVCRCGARSYPDPACTRRPYCDRSLRPELLSCN